MSDDLLTVAQAAERLKVTPNWLQRQASQGKVPSRKLGRVRLFTETDLQRILAAAARGRESVLTPGSAAYKRRQR